MEAVPLDAALAEVAGQRHHGGDRRVAAMEAGVEAGHLRHVGHAVEDGFDRREVVRLVERGQRRQLLQLGEDLPRDHGGAAEARAAVDHPVATPTMRPP